MRNNVATCRAAILRVLADGAYHRHSELEKASRRWMARGDYLSLMSDMLRDHLIAQARDGYVITSRGQKLLPKAVGDLPPLRPYQRPVEPPRRPGSDWRGIPSVFAGELQPYREHL